MNTHRETTTPAGAWFPYDRPAATARHTLICLPYAGGGASAYLPWRSAGPLGADLCTVQPPGREGRGGEEPLRTMAALVTACAAALVTRITRPYALFGHSLGALTAFELARTLPTLGLPAPVRLFVAAARPPDTWPLPGDLHKLNDDAILRHLRPHGQVPAELADHPRLRRQALKTIRADLEICCTYRVTGGPIDTPITVLGGTEDPIVPAADLPGWSAWTTRGAEVRLSPGGHFLDRARWAAARKLIESQVAADLL
ncbi:thioesterase II family protein [Streptomyces sp. NPDC053542]|uniref:thioesterase II family protein n=1 Tax=Streptomyces sp. NPDC053542 TaxID=3365710 RepID=UPI0037D573DA